MSLLSTPTPCHYFLHRHHATTFYMDTMPLLSTPAPCHYFLYGHQATIFYTDTTPLLPHYSTITTTTTPPLPTPQRITIATIAIAPTPTQLHSIYFGPRVRRDGEGPLDPIEWVRRSHKIRTGCIPCI